MKTFSLPNSKDFEHTINGKNTHFLVLQNNRGMHLGLTDYGARVVNILVPDKDGNLVDVALGFGSIFDYLNTTEPYYGATIGRYANRIANGTFTLNDTTYKLFQNNKTNSLHGGPNGFHNQVWDRRVNFENDIDFVLFSADGEEGFPGNIHVTVNYELTNDNEIIITYHASSDQDTILNLTNHTFFNLNGEGNGNILNHNLQIFSDHYIPINELQIPLGQEASVYDSPFDFRNNKTIGKDIYNDHPQMQNGNGFDHTFVNKKGLNNILARAHSPQSGIVMEVWTSEPGLQLYTGNFIKGTEIGKSNVVYERHSAFCLETQHYPNSPNQPNFPSTVLKKGEEYVSKTIYKFSLAPMSR